MKKNKFKPPRDIKQFWIAPHCGPGSLDADEDCGFCGRPMRDCAEEASEIVEKEFRYPGDGNRGEGCGGSGMWCKGCGRFWAQDSCGESNGDVGELRAADGAELVNKDGYWHCVCGRKLIELPHISEENLQKIKSFTDRLEQLGFKKGDILDWTEIFYFKGEPYKKGTIEVSFMFPPTVLPELYQSKYRVCGTDAPIEFKTVEEMEKAIQVMRMKWRLKKQN